MPGKPLAVLGSTETIFFSTHDGELCQWITVTVANQADEVRAGTVRITAGGGTVETRLQVEAGVRDYRCYAPVLWPSCPPEAGASLRLEAGGDVCEATVSVGHHRPWTVYLLSDVCTDYAWAYSDEQAFRTDDADLMEAELYQAEATGDMPDPNRNHYNLVHAREVEFFLERHPDQANRLWDHVRQGDVTLNPFFNMCLTGNMSLEELVRHFYPARRRAVEHDLDLAYANHQETPTLTWAAAMVLAGCGVLHLVKSILQVETPWAQRLAEPPVFVWEGPDGSRVLVRRSNSGYAEGSFVLRGVHRIFPNLHERILPAYEELGDAYPFDAVGLVGCYGDLSPRTKYLTADKVRGVAAHNAHDWEYPLLVNASHEQFWDRVEAQMAVRGIDLPVSRGDYGTSWEVWAACLAHDFMGWRRAQERAGLADRMAAVVRQLCPDDYETVAGHLARGWVDLSYLPDHAWNGSSDGNLELNKSLRRRWQVRANSGFDTVVTEGLRTVRDSVPAGDERRVIVFNGLGWERSGIARIEGVTDSASVTDMETGRTVASQVVQEGDESALVFLAPRVPSVGYRAFSVSAGKLSEGTGKEGVQAEGPRLEGPFYALEVSPDTGAIVSLFDKVRGRELVDGESPYHLNQCLHYSHGVEHTAVRATVEQGAGGPVLGRLHTCTWLKNTEVRSTITLYAGLDRVDICNRVHKAVTTEPQEMDFAFPFAVPDHRYRLEAPGAVLDPQRDFLPGAGLAVLAVRHFVDVFNDEFGVTLSQADSGFVQLGHRTSREDLESVDMGRSTVLALAMQNCFDKTEAALDQGGVSDFTFRYSLQGHGAGFAAARAVRFGWEDNNELLVAESAGGAVGALPEDVHAFVSVEPDNVILTCLKVAEEEGLIVRLWECAGQETQAVVRPRGLGALVRAYSTDLLERDAKPLSVVGGEVAVRVPARGMAALRLIFD